jgi:hypothetical protein
VFWHHIWRPRQDSLQVSSLILRVTPFPFPSNVFLLRRPAILFISTLPLAFPTLSCSFLLAPLAEYSLINCCSRHQRHLPLRSFRRRVLLAGDFFWGINSLINSKPSILHLAIFADSSADLTFVVIKFLRRRELRFGGTLACMASYLTECSLWRSPCSHPSKASRGRVFSIEANEGEANVADRPHPRTTPGRTRKAGSGEKSTSAQTKHVRRRSKSARASNDVDDISERRRSVGAV